MIHYNVPKVKKETYFAKLRTEKDKLNVKSRQFIEEMLYTDEEYRWQTDYWKEQIKKRMHGKDVWKLSDIFPKSVYPALDIMMGEDFRKQFLEICDRMTDFPYTEGYYRRMIRSKNYRHHFERISHSFLSHFVTCHIMGYDIMTMLNQDFEQEVRQELSDYYALEIDRNNKAVITAVKEMILSDNNTKLINYYVVQGILKSRNRELLELLGNLLLAAKLQEGVRQMICENIDCGLQENFVFFFDLIYDNNLMRFSSVKRAIATFTGMGESFADRLTKKELELIHSLNHNKTDVECLIQSDDNVEATLGLWKKGSEDLLELIKSMNRILESGKRHSHLMVSYYLDIISDRIYSSEIAKKIIKKYCLDGEVFEKENGLEILACYHHFLLSGHNVPIHTALEKEERKQEEYFSNKQDAKELFACLERGLSSMATKEKVFSPCIFPWYSVGISKYNLARNMAFCTLYLQGEYVEKMTEYMKFLEWQLSDFLNLLYSRPQSKRQKDMLIDLLGDRNINTKAVYEIIKENHFAKDYMDVIEGLLRLKTPTIRQAAIELIYNQKEEELKCSIENLIVQKDVQKRLGALDLLLRCKNEKKFSQKEIKGYIKKIVKITTAEQVLIDELTVVNKDLANELYDANYRPDIPFHLTAVTDLKKQFSKTADQLYDILKKLNDLFTQKENYEYKTHYGREVLLKDCFVSMNKKHDAYEKEGLKDFPLAELWYEFYEKEIGDFKVLQQLYILLQYEGEEKDELDELEESLLGIKNDTFSKTVQKDTEKTSVNRFLKTLFRQDLYALTKKLNDEPLTYCGDFYNNRQVIRIIGLLFETEKEKHKNELIAFAKTVFSKLMEQYEVRDFAVVEEDWQKNKHYDLPFYNEPMLRELIAVLDDCDNDSDFKEIFSLKYKVEQEMLDLSKETGIPYEYTRLYLSEVAYAVRLGLAQQDIFYQRVLSDNKERVNNGISTISSYLTNKYPDPAVRGYNPFILTAETVQWIKEHGKKIVDYIVALELKRGDMPLVYSKAIHRIKRIEGMETMVEILKAMGDLKLDRNSWYWSNGDSKKETLSHLLKVSYPLEEDNAKGLKRLLKGTDISERRLTEVAMYSPQWISILEEYLGWKGLASGCYYFHAHTSDVDKKKEGLFAKYTPISIEDLRDGAFDVDWFREAYKDLGAENFNLLYESAKYISDGAKHGRARKFADAVLGKFKVKDTEKEISEKRNKDLLAAYGLIPLAKDKKKDLLRRYKFLQKFLKESKKFGSQRRTSEAKAFQIALENLSRNAGYTDVTRLIWSMETALIDEIKEFFNFKEAEGVSVRIQIDEVGRSELIYEKDGKLLKSLPAKLKKNSYIETLKEVHKNLKEQYSRSKKMLEEAMEDGTIFYAEEIDDLINNNPVISPLLKNLVMKNEKNLGYYKDEMLWNPSGKSMKLKPDSALVIAHALDLYRSGNWHEFQQDLFERQVKQPFKQVFRELYVKTEDENGIYDSLRYAGHQIQPQKTVAVLKNRRWIIDGQEGLQKVYYKGNLIARIYALADWYSPADIEAPTLESVQFFDRKSFQPVPIDKVPDLIFTEVMRDVDLAVSIAHIGGVDPESSHSTIQMRKAIVEFNLPLFKIDNVGFTDKHAIIQGKLAEYSVHLGSGVVHQKAGTAIQVLPVHSQHRGKLFLPFVDEDPKTAEIMAKILLFARDEKIKDANILEQIKKK